MLNTFLDLLKFSFGIPTLTKNFDKLTTENIQNLFNLSKKHDVAHLIGSSLMKNGLLDTQPEIKKLFQKEINLAIFRYEQQNFELERIKALFEKENIDYILLKGAVIRNYYPQPWMRTSCDIDILVRENQLKKAIDCLQKELKCRCDGIGNHDAQIYTDSGVHVELHYSLIDGDANEQLKEIYSKIFDVCTKNSGNLYKMSDDLVYLYAISHMAKHFKVGGCGVRSILDLWILNHSENFNVKNSRELLQKTGLLSFAQAMENLSEVWLSNKKPDELCQSITEYILTGGTYGSFENRVSVQKSRKRNKFSYFWSRLFVPYSQLKYTYPKLQKAPILYPFYIVNRWFKVIFDKETKKRTAYEIEQTKNFDKEKQEKINNIMEKLEI